MFGVVIVETISVLAQIPPEEDRQKKVDDQLDDAAELAFGSGPAGEVPDRRGRSG